MSSRTRKLKIEVVTFDPKVHYPINDDCAHKSEEHWGHCFERMGDELYDDPDGISYDLKNNKSSIEKHYKEYVQFHYPQAMLSWEEFCGIVDEIFKLQKLDRPLVKKESKYLRALWILIQPRKPGDILKKVKERSVGRKG